MTDLAANGSSHHPSTRQVVLQTGDRGVDRQRSSSGSDDDPDVRERYKEEFKALGDSAATMWIARFRVDLAAQAVLMAIAVAASVAALGYAVVKGNAMAEGALASRPNGQPFIERLVALTWPVVVLAVLAALAAIGSWMTHLRTVSAYRCSFEALTQYWRDNSVPVQGRDVEDQVDFSRKAFSVLMWLARTLFIVSLGLFAAAVISMIVRGELDLAAVLLGAGSLAGALYGTAQAVPNNVTNNLADVVQIQTAAGGCNRELALLEHTSKQRDTYGDIDPFLIQHNMDVAVANAMERIQFYSEVRDETRSPGDAAGDRAECEPVVVGADQ